MLVSSLSLASLAAVALATAGAPDSFHRPDVASRAKRAVQFGDAAIELAERALVTEYVTVYTTSHFTKTVTSEDPCTTSTSAKKEKHSTQPRKKKFSHRYAHHKVKSSSSSPKSKSTTNSDKKTSTAGASAKAKTTTKAKVTATAALNLATALPLATAASFSLELSTAETVTHLASIALALAPTTTAQETIFWSDIAVSQPTGVYAPSNVEALSLAAHNALRAQYGADKLAWNMTLQEMAQTAANGCVFSDDGFSGVGSNIAAISGTTANATAQIAMWSNEASLYDPSVGYSDASGHFSQMIWRATTTVGCAQAACPAGSIFDAVDGVSNYFVCKYWPAGNVIGEFATEVEVLVA